MLRHISNAFRRIWEKRGARSSVETISPPGEVAGEIDFRELETRIGYHPVNRAVFLEALLHRSYLPFVQPGHRSNERLEFLGDSILNFLVADHLHHSYRGMGEGELTKLRARLVNRRVLAQRARAIRLSEFLLLSPSALQSLDSGSESILSDGFEALIGAIYLDGGLDMAREFVHRTLLSHESVLQSALMDDNFKSALLEHTQSHGLGVPRYVTVREEGPDHDRRFTVDVYVGEQKMGTGSGHSKKDAEQAAAAVALSHKDPLEPNENNETTLQI